MAAEKTPLFAGPRSDGAQNDPQLFLLFTSIKYTLIDTSYSAGNGVATPSTDTPANGSIGNFRVPYSESYSDLHSPELSTGYLTTSARRNPVARIFSRGNDLESAGTSHHYTPAGRAFPHLGDHPSQPTPALWGLINTPPLKPTSYPSHLADLDQHYK